MGCAEIKNEQGAVIGWICGTGGRPEKAIRKRRRWKWCFNCCKRLPHMLTMSYDPQPSYYEPTIFWKCSGCGEDFTLFPGQFYD
jgi:hypothetical protein